MRRGILALLMAAILSIVSVQMTALAENEGGTSEPVYGDAIVTVSVENPECLQLNELEAAEITAVIGLKSVTDFEPLEIPVESLEMDLEGEEAELSFWLGYKEKAIEKAFLTYLSDLQGDILGDLEEEFEGDADISEMEENVEEVLEETSALLNEITIEFKGLPEHYKVDMDYTIVTHEVVTAIVEMIHELLSWIYPEINIDELGVTGLIEMILEEEGTSLDKLIAELATEDPELAEQVKVLFEEIDKTLAYMQSDEFPGLLFAGATLSCDCPVKASGQILHEYYKNVNGTLEYVGSKTEDLEDYTGKIIKADDYVKCEYDGVVYEYMGSFNADVMFEEAYFVYDWSGYEMNEFALGDENYWALLLRYEIIGEKDSVEEIQDNDKEKEEPVQIKDKNSESREAAPATGDVQNFRVLIMIATGALGVIILKLRKMNF